MTPAEIVDKFGYDGWSKDEGDAMELAIDKYGQQERASSVAKIVAAMLDGTVYDAVLRELDKADPLDTNEWKAERIADAVRFAVGVSR